MSDNKEQVKELKAEDEEEGLDELLKSALEDFKNPPNLPGSSNAAKVPDTLPQAEGLNWTEEFIQQAASFDKTLKTLLGDDSGEQSAEQFEAEMQKMAEAAAQVLSDGNVGASEFSEIMSQTLKNLAENMDGFQKNISEEELSKMFSEVGINDGGDDEGELIKSMQHVIQFLLSKDILYPVLCDFVNKYPEWIEKNSHKLSSSEVERYKKQNDLMAKICEEFKNDSDSDAPEVKNERFTRIFSLMQKMQEYGEPPRDLIDQLELPQNSDGQQNDFLAQGKTLCSIM